MQSVYRYIAVGLIGFSLGCYYTHNKYVPNFESKIANKNTTIADLRQVIRKQELAKQEENTVITYMEKQGKSDSDVELTDKNKITVRVNDKNYELPNNVSENSKFENGKVVINRQNLTTFDLTNTVNELADEKAKKYSRVGKVDFGCIYNRKEHDLYGGLRYNAKTWDAGFYHNVNGDDWLIGVHYKF